MSALVEIALLVALSGLSAPVTSEEGRDQAKPVPPAGGSLDDELFDDLSEELMEDLAPQPRPQSSKSDDATDRELERSLEKAEADDAGASPIGKLSRQMREVEDRLGARQAGFDTQRLQQRIVGNLDDLIKELQRKKRSSSSQSSQSSQGSRRSQPKQPSSQPGSSGSGTTETAQSEGPARESSDELRKDRSERPDLVDMQQQLKELWGHLPEKAREEMLQSSIDEFLPKYQLLIEEYFRRLVKEQTP